MISICLVSVAELENLIQDSKAVPCIFYSLMLPLISGNEREILELEIKITV